MRGRDEAGAVTLFMVLMVPVLLIGLGGLVFDGGRILVAKRQAMNVAQQAARAGAQGVATEDIRTGATGAQRLDPDRARARAEAHLVLLGHSGTVSVEGEVVRVTVTVERQARLLPFGATQVRATAEARNVRGVLEAET